MSQNLLQKYYTGIMFVVIVIMAILAYYAGYLEGKRSCKTSISLQCSPEVLKTLTLPKEGLQMPKITDKASATASGAFVGSKNGTKYYGPSCSMVARIKKENRIWFKNEEDATLQGYSRGSC